MGKEIKTLPFEMKLNESKRTIEGYASTFGNKDLVGDIVEPGAFKKTIQESGNRVKLLWQHAEPLGKPLRMAEDSKGLHVEAYISKTSLGNDALELVNDGVIDRMSIGYQVVKDRYEPQEKTRYLKELKLMEFSLVTFPANEEAAITGTKSYSEFMGLLSKTSALDVTRLLKEGRALNSTNRQLIEDAIRALQSVLDIEVLEPRDQDEPDDDDDLETDSRKAHSLNAGKPLLNIDDLKAIANNFKMGGY